MVGTIGHYEISRAIESHAYGQIHGSRSNGDSVAGARKPFLYARIAVIEDVHVPVGVKGDRRGTAELVGIGTGITGRSCHGHALSGS